MRYEIVPFDKIAAVNQFNEIGLSNWENDFFSPLTPASFLVQCVGEEKVIGCEGYIGYHLIKKGEIFLTHKSERTLVDAHYRGKGIFEKLVQKCDEAAMEIYSQFVWGETTAFKAFQRAGFEPFTGFRTYVFYPIQKGFFQKVRSFFSNIALFNPISLYKIVKSKDLDALKTLVSFFCAFKPIRKVEMADISFETFDFEKIKNYLLAQSDDSYKIYISENLIKWLNKKGYHYNYQQIVFQNEIIGYVILSCNVAKNSCHIVDIHFDSKKISMINILQSLANWKPLQGFDALFLALNAENEIHQNWLKTIAQHKILHKRMAGNFVIKPLLQKNISIKDLLITDLWLVL